MRRWLWFVLAVIVASGSTQVFAQEQQETFYGIRGDQFISYTLDGTQTVLLGGVNPQAPRLLKTDLPEQPLLVAEVDGTIGLYLVGSVQRPQAITLPEGFVMEDMNWVILSHHHPYYLLQSSLGVPESLGLLVNIDTLEAQTLGKILFFNKESAAFSEDGTKLRYGSRESDSNNTWHLVERDLISGDENIFYTVDDFYPVFSFDSFGDHWLFSQSDRDTQIYTTYLIHPDRTITEIAQEDQGSQQFRIIWNDQLYLSPARCETDCPIKITPFDPSSSDTGFAFTAPAIETLPVPLAMPDANRLLIIDSGNYWLLNTDGTAKSLGIYNAATIYTPRVLSDDQRWLMSLTTDEEGEPAGYKVWDLQKDTAVIEGELPVGLNVVFDDEGIVVWEYQDTQKVYRFSDGQTFTLDIGRRETLFTLANAQIGLVSVSKDSKIGAAGIYAYDLDAKTYTLLAADTRSLVAF